MERDALDLGTEHVGRLFRKFFVPTLLGMLSISAVTVADGIFVGHGVGSDGIAAINICIPLLMIFTGFGLMVGAGCSVVASGRRTPSGHVVQRRFSIGQRRARLVLRLSVGVGRLRSGARVDPGRSHRRHNRRGLSFPSGSDIAVLSSQSQPQKPASHLA